MSNINNMQTSMRVLNELIQDTDEDLSMQGCDTQFVKTFATNEMKMDFSIIANSFYMNVPEALTYRNYEFSLDSISEAYYPYEGFIIFTMSQILSMAKSGNEYSVQLLRYLYTIYYKKEYKLINNLRSISVNKIFELSEIKTEKGISTVARILTMCRLFNIIIEEDCSILYNYLNKYNKQEEKYINIINRDIAVDKHSNTMATTIREMYGVESFDEIIKSSTILSEYNRFRKDVYKDLGFRFELSEMPNDNDFFEKCFNKSLSILKEHNPNKKYTKEELQGYVSILYDAIVLCNTMDGIDEYFKRILGEVDDYIIEQSKFDPKEFERFVGIKTIKRIDDNNIYNMNENSISDNKEIIALRKHILEMSEENVLIQENELLEMIDAIKTIKVGIFGEHHEWMGRLRELFPNWMYINTQSNSICDNTIFNSIERVYFFADYVMKNEYKEYLRILCQKNLIWIYK